MGSARAGAARSVNTTHVVANWLIGWEIVEEEQKRKAKAGYGENLMRDLASTLAEEYGDGYGLTNLKMIRKFYLTYRELVGFAKGHAPCDKSDAPRRKTAQEALPRILYSARKEFWRPGRQPVVS